MKRDLFLWQFGGFALSSLFGTLLHFLYDWTNKSILTAPFSGVNESTWEHMKLLYFPLFIFALIQSRFFEDVKNFWTVKLLGIGKGLILIPVLFYTYNGAFGKSPDWLNIGIFYFSSASAFLRETQLFKKERKINFKLSFVFICLIEAAFVIFTFWTPHLPLFKDPLTGKYGI